MNASPEVDHLANTGIGSRNLVVLSAIVVMQGCRLYNGSMIAAALMATWYCLANTGSAAATGGGPLFWLDLLFRFPFSKNGFGACVKVVGRGEWSVQALRRIELQPRLQCLVALGYIHAKASAKHNNVCLLCFD